MGRKKKEQPSLPAGFPAIGSYVGYYYEGNRHGILEAIKGRIAKISRPGKRSLNVPITDIEIEPQQ